MRALMAGASSKIITHEHLTYICMNYAIMHIYEKRLSRLLCNACSHPQVGGNSKKLTNKHYHLLGFPPKNEYKNSHLENLRSRFYSFSPSFSVFDGIFFLPISHPKRC